MKGIQQMQNNWKTYLAEGFKAPLPSEALKLSKDDWRKRLSPAAYSVLREEGTERAGTSPLNNEKREGVFACAGCGPAASVLWERPSYRAGSRLERKWDSCRHFCATSGNRTNHCT